MHAWKYVDPESGRQLLYSRVYTTQRGAPKDPTGRTPFGVTFQTNPTESTKRTPHTHTVNMPRVSLSVV